jgi:hypothetical protein
MRPSMSIAATAVLLAVCATRAAYSADVDLGAFIGTWKENTAKSRTAISSALTYTFSEETDGFVTIVRGGVQVRDSVRVDGKDYPTPGIAGRSVSWTKVGDTAYETTIKRNGALLGTGRWILSEGGKHLTQETTPTRADGQNDANVIEYVRASGESNSLLGVWKPVSSRSVVPDLFIVTRIDGGALKVFYPKNLSSYTIRPDGKEYPRTATNALPDLMTSAEALGPRSLRHTTSRGHTATLETVMTVSPDGKAMTITTYPPGSSDEPSVFVYEKQD